MAAKKNRTPSLDLKLLGAEPIDTEDMIRKKIFISFLIFPLFCGCIGIGMPQPLQRKPYTLLRGGDQIGRDQLANRTLVADLKVPIKGLNSNEVLSILGQPQQIKVTEKNVSEDWYFSYYKRYKTFPKTPQGSFLVRFYHNKVIQVAKIK